MVKMTILTMTILPFYHQMVMVKWSKLTDISTNFNNSNNKIIWKCKDCNDQVSIDHFDHENFVILGMVKVKIGLTILTIEPQFWPNGHRTPTPPPSCTLNQVIENYQTSSWTSGHGERSQIVTLPFTSTSF